MEVDTQPVAQTDTPLVHCRWDFCTETFVNLQEWDTHFVVDHLAYARAVDLAGRKQRKRHDDVWELVDEELGAQDQLPILSQAHSQTTGDITTTTHTLSFPVPPSFHSLPDLEMGMEIGDDPMGSLPTGMLLPPRARTPEEVEADLDADRSYKGIYKSFINSPSPPPGHSGSGSGSGFGSGSGSGMGSTNVHPPPPGQRFQTPLSSQSQSQSESQSQSQAGSQPNPESHSGSLPSQPALATSQSQLPEHESGSGTLHSTSSKSTNTNTTTTTTTTSASQNSSGSGKDVPSPLRSQGAISGVGASTSTLERSAEVTARDESMIASQESVEIPRTRTSSISLGMGPLKFGAALPFSVPKTKTDVNYHSPTANTIADASASPNVDSNKEKGEETDRGVWHHSPSTTLRRDKEFVSTPNRKGTGVGFSWGGG